MHERSQVSLYRCYGVVDWPGIVNGARTSLDPTHGSVNNYFLFNGIWAIDTSPTSGSCNSSEFSGNPDWVEAGYRLYGSKAGTIGGINVNNSYRWMWGDCRPGSTFYEHPSNYVINDNDFFENANVSIQRASSNSWSVSITGGSTGQVWSGTSANNAMKARDIKMGLELSSDSGFSNESVNFTNNQYEDLSGGNFGHWDYQNNSGKEIINYPADGYWASPPASNGSNNGGDWVSCVSNAGC